MTRHRTIIRLSAVLAVVALAKGCGDEGPVAVAPPPPTIESVVSVCDRTEQIRDEIVQQAGVSACTEIEIRHLTAITGMGFSGAAITALREGDFAGLSRLGYLSLSRNELTALPEGVFTGLSRLRHLDLAGNELTVLPENVFAGLASLELLYLMNNQLTELPEGVFAGLSSLDVLLMWDNGLTALPEGVFAGLFSLQRLNVSNNALTVLPGGVFAGLSGLEVLRLFNNQLVELPEGVFASLSGLVHLNLSGNGLATLPESMFAGLSSLEGLGLLDNPGAPFVLTLALERRDNSDLLASGPARIAVSVAEGMPFDLMINLSVQGGTLSTAVAEARAGSRRSGDITVTRSTGSQTATHVSAGPTPQVPRGFTGIEIAVSDPLVLFAETSNHTPVANQAIPSYRLQASGRAAVLDLSLPYFGDPDGDALTYTAASSAAAVAGASVSGSRMTLTPGEVGSTTVTVTATDAGGLFATQPLAVDVRGAGSGGSFDIDVVLVDPVTEAQSEAVREAVELWTAILANEELPEVAIADGDDLSCGGLSPGFRRVEVDDLMILASIRKIDGEGGVYAQAAVCRVRDGSGLPYLGLMEFDETEMERLAAEGVARREVILHEMGHVLGIGSLWNNLGLLRNPSGPDNPGADTHFAGPLAIEAFDMAGGTAYTDGAKVPVENSAGPGANIHWRESVLGRELMTSVQDREHSNPLSAITIQSLSDLGYTVDVSQAEAFRVPGTRPVTGPAPAAPPGYEIDLSSDVVRAPVLVVDENGRIVRVIPP